MRFSDEVVDIGFPGEEALGGSRYAKKVYCEGGSFIGNQGEQFVKASGGAWTSEVHACPAACPPACLSRRPARPRSHPHAELLVDRSPHCVP